MSFVVVICLCIGCVLRLRRRLASSGGVVLIQPHARFFCRRVFDRHGDFFVQLFVGSRRGQLYFVIMKLLS